MRRSFPFVALLVSGGHTQLMRVDGVGQYTILGETIDDAAGEAFDKSAKLLGLPYPGGPELAKLAEGGNPQAFKSPRPLLHSGDLDFSFAGLKTAVLTQAKKSGGSTCPRTRPIWRPARKPAIVEVLVKKTVKAVQQSGMQRLVVAGGVGANRLLREQLNAVCAAARHSRALPRAAFVYRQRRDDCHGGRHAPASGPAAGRLQLCV